MFRIQAAELRTAASAVTRLNLYGLWRRSPYAHRMSHIAYLIDRQFSITVAFETVKKGIE